jgi:hypothetical protein
MDPIIRHEYRSRSIAFLELWYHSGWRLKIYGITPDAERPDSALISGARTIAMAALPQPAVTQDRYGVGFMGVHQGRGSNLVFVDWWENENELFHRSFVSSPAKPNEFSNVTATGPSACVWDLAVMSFERQAWVAAVLQAPGGPDLARYLDAHFEGMI